MDITESKTLRVTGPDFVAGLVIGKNEDTGKWEIVFIAPILRAIIGRTPLEYIGRTLEAKKLKYEWV